MNLFRFLSLESEISGISYSRARVSHVLAEKTHVSITDQARSEEAVPSRLKMHSRFLGKWELTLPSGMRSVSSGSEGSSARSLLFMRRLSLKHTSKLASYAQGNELTNCEGLSGRVPIPSCCLPFPLEDHWEHGLADILQLHPSPCR